MQFDALAFKENPHLFFKTNDFNKITLRCVIDTLFDANYNFSKRTLLYDSFMHHVLDLKKLKIQTDNIEYLFTKGFSINWEYQIVIENASVYKKDHDYINLETFCKHGLIKIEQHLGHYPLFPLYAASYNNKYYRYKYIQSCVDTDWYIDPCRLIFNNFNYTPDPRVFRILLKYDYNEIIKKMLIDENNDHIRNILETRYLPIYHMIFLNLYNQKK